MAVRDTKMHSSATLKSVAGSTGKLHFLGQRPDHAGHYHRHVKIARGYTIFARMMVFLLPATIIALLSLLFVWPALWDQDIDLATQEDLLEWQGEAFLQRPHFVGLDEDNRYFNMQAHEAQIVSEDQMLLSLSELQGQVTLSWEENLDISSQTGLLNRQFEILTLDEEVELEHSNGTVLQTERAYIDFAQGSGWGDRQVIGEGPAGRIEASDGFEILDQGRRIMFYGETELLLR